jgi:hypothetical protein
MECPFCSRRRRMLDVFERAKEALRVVYENPLAYVGDKVADLQDLAHDIQVYLEILKKELPDMDREDPLDGDHESALASCGWGTDEDYGLYDQIK